MESPCFKTDFIGHEANTFSNNKKQVIYSNNTTGPRLTANVVSVTQCIFSLLGATELVLTCLRLLKRHSNSDSNELICRLKFAFNECKF